MFSNCSFWMIAKYQIGLFIYFQDDIMLHPDFEMNSPDFNEMSDNEKESPAKELNNSIRKKLFDQNDNDNDDHMMGTDSPK